jgi:opacity protein-like surface antigen
VSYLGAGIGLSQFEFGGTYRAIVGGTTYNLPFDAQDDVFAFQVLAGLNYRLYQAHMFTIGLNDHFW